MPEPAIYHESAGQGTPTLVFVHGWCADSSDWRYQRAFFAPSNRVVTCDLRGHGNCPELADGYDIETGGRDVAHLLATDDIAPAVLVAHGMGCRVALEATRHAPDLLTGLVLVDGDRHVVGDPDAALAESRAR